MAAMRSTLSLVPLFALLALACSTPATTPSPGVSGASASSSAPSGGQQSLEPQPSPGDTDPGLSPPPASTDPGASLTPPSSGDPTDPPVTGFDPSRVKVTLEPLVTGLDAPVAVTHAGDGTGTLYIVERAGRILVLEPDGALRDEPLLDIRDRVDTQGERGLHYVVFHPGFESNGRFFIHGTDVRNQSFIDEYRTDGQGTVPRDSGRTVLRIDQPDWDNHKGGWMGFGPDGMLYIALGDGGGVTPGDPFGNGQDRSDLLGNILRIDVDVDVEGGQGYAIPPDNPFAKRGSGGGGARREIWAYGLRNPWRASFDRQTGDLWIGDVGQDTTEEIDVIPSGQGGLNFGWSDMEGRRCHLDRDCDPSRYTAPIAVYGTRDEGCAVTGGYVYRGTASSLLSGGYVFSDYCSGTIWGFDAEAALDAGDARMKRLASTPYNIVSLGEDEAGELLAVDFGGGIYRIGAAEKP